MSKNTATQDFKVPAQNKFFILGEEVSQRVYEYFEAKNIALDKYNDWSEEVLAALEGLPDNTTADAIRWLRNKAGV